MSLPSPNTGSIARWIVLIVIFAGVIAIALVAINAMGVIIPSFVVTIGWIIVIVFVAVGAISLLMRMFKV